MRKIFLIALFALCAIEGFSQRYTPFQGWGFSARRLKADSVSIVPSDTVINKAPNSVAIFNGRVYFQNGTRWQDISYDLPINVRDSISALYPLLYNSSTGVLSADTGRNAASIATGGVVNKVKDSLAASIVLRLLISDTSSMLSSYRTTLNTVQVNKLNISDSSLYSTRGRLYKVTDSLGAIISSVTPDSSVYSTKAWRQKGIDSVQANLTAGLALKLNLSDSSLYASRGRLYKVADSLGSVIASVSADSLVFSTKAYRQKGVDSVQANLTAGLSLKLNISDTSSMLSPYYRTALANATIVQRITDSLSSLVRLRASGSGGIDVQNSSGTSVANFGSGGSTNISLNGSTNVNARLSVTDSIVGVNQRLSNDLLIRTVNKSADGVSLSNASNVSFSEGSNESYVNLFRQRNTAATVLAMGYRRSNTGLFASSASVSFAKSAIVIGYNSGSIAFFTDSATNVSTGTDITPTERVTILNNGNFGINNTNPSTLLDVNGTGRFSGALTATAQGNNIAYTVDSTTISTSNYTLVAGDASKRFYIKNSSTAITVTIPADASVNFPVGTEIIFFQDGTGDITIAGASGVTLKSGSSLAKLGERYAFAGVVKLSANTWGFTGNRK